MLRTESVYLRQIIGLSRAQFSIVWREIARTDLPDDSTQWFVDAEEGEGSLLATLVIKCQAVHTLLLTGRLQEQIITYYRKIPFAIDLKHGILEVYGGLAQTNKVASVIGSLLRFQCPIEDVAFSLTGAYNALLSKGYQAEIIKLSISNFRPMPGVCGRFSPTITQSPIGLSLLEQYSKDVIDAVFQLRSSQQSEFTVRISTRGGLAIRAESDDIDALLEDLKRILLSWRSIDA